MSYTEQLPSPLVWSEEFDFIAALIRQNAPQSAGVYMILQAQEYPRYKRVTRVLKIGCSEQSLRNELLNHLGRHTASNRLARCGGQPDARLSFKFAVSDSSVARKIENKLLRDFEEDHWDYPVLNSQRGFKRGEDTHFRT